MIDSESEYLSSVRRAEAAAAEYYDGAGEVMSDAEYDKLLDDISTTEEDHHNWVIEHHLFDRVAAGVSAGGEVTHPSPMLSLDKVTDDPAAMRRWIDSVDAPVVVEPKLDGMAIRAVYRDGRMSQVVTRGDGYSGEDITDRARKIVGLPIYSGGGDFEVRGEVYMSDVQFVEANRQRIDMGEEPFANQRNAVAGILRNDSVTFDGHVMSFAAYDFDDDGGYGRSWAVYELYRSLGFQTARNLMTLSTPTAHVGDTIRVIDELAGLRENLGYPIDGAVVKVDRYADRERLGATSRAPRWALAYKFPAKRLTAVVEDIETSIGRTGRLALRARINPTVVDGSTVTYASLHNVSWLQDQDIRIGDTVELYKAGDVIPRVESPVLRLRPDRAERWVPPETDPAGNPWDKTTLLWRSTSPELSVAANLVYAASRDALDIDGMSTAIIEALVASGKVIDLPGLLLLDYEDLRVLATTGDDGNTRRIGESVAARIAEGVESAKQAPPARVITALGIRGTGRTMSRRLAARFGSLESLRGSTVERLSEVDGIGGKKAELIRSEVDRLDGVIARLISMGIGAVEDDSVGKTGGPLAGMTVVVTGSMSGTALDGMSRNEVNELIESAGGTASGSVSAGTDLLVCAGEGTSKWKKAVRLGVRVASPNEFARMTGAS